MLTRGLFAGIERGLNQVLRLDGTALPRLKPLTGKVIAIVARQPELTVYLLPGEDGIMLATTWAAEADCTLRAPATSLARLALSDDKNAILHSPEVSLEGDSAALLDLVGVLQDLELDWEYELSRWVGPVAAHLIGGHLRSRANWHRGNARSLTRNLGEYLAEESRALVGRHEAEAKFSEIDRLKVDIDRLEARIRRLARLPDPSDNA